MYKLKDVIASGGKNPKINKALDRYELSKEEKKDIVNEVKNISGSGGSTSSGGSNIEYLDGAEIQSGLDSQSLMSTYILMLAYRVKILKDGVYGILGAQTPGNFNGTVIGIEIDFNSYISLNSSLGLLTVKDFLILIGVQQQQLDAIPRITKEEFYTL